MARQYIDNRIDVDDRVATSHFIELFAAGLSCYW